MRLLLECIIAGAAMATLGMSSVSVAETPHHGHHRHRHTQSAGGSRAVPPNASADADEGLVASPNSIGSLYGGIGRAYDNGVSGYNGPLGFGLHASEQVGSALVGGGAAGNAYADYLKHYYFYKYDYCPIGKKYVWYLQRCFGLADLFQ